MMAEKSIEEIAREAVPKITILGVGGGGSNIVSWLKKDAVTARTIALNSDAQHLTVTKADDKPYWAWEAGDPTSSPGSRKTPSRRGR
jgi:cell division GTPase FtsZ